MALDSDNIIEQIAQIDSELGATGAVDGEISNISQVDSFMQPVIAVDLSAIYIGQIHGNDWQKAGDYWYYTISYNTHNLMQPFVDEFLVENEDGYENAVYSYNVLANRGIRFKSSFPVEAYYKISGKK
jgi:hypothetical protein